MDSAVTSLFLLGYFLVVSGSPFGHSPSSFMVFSAGTQLLVKTEEQTPDYYHQNQAKGSSTGPAVQILSTFTLHQDPASPHLLVCLLTGLSSPVQSILWWVNDRMEMSTGTTLALVMSEGSGAYSASSVLEVSATDRRSRSTYWCGTVQAGQVYRQRLCQQNQL